MAGNTHKHSKDVRRAGSKKRLSFNESVKNVYNTESAEVAEQVKIDVIEAEDTKVSAPDATTYEVKESPKLSVKAKTHARNAVKNAKEFKPNLTFQKKSHRVASLVFGGVALVVLVSSGVLSQYFKNKTLPNVSVANISSTAKSAQQLKDQLNQQRSSLKISFKSDEKVFSPKFEEIGFSIDVDKTVENALNEKRNEGLFKKLAFWNKVNVPAVVSLNDTLLNQYVEANTPQLLKAPQDSQLQFDANQGEFIVTPQADGQAPNIEKIKKDIYGISDSLSSQTLAVGVAKKGPVITEAGLKPLVAEGNELTARKVIFSGLGFTYQARPADIASWLTPTPQKDGKVILAVDNAKVQSYVDSISKKISNAPVDKKVLKDETTGTEVIIQQGRDGTELADKQTLANAVTQALKNGKDTTQTMNITTAAYQTVNMNAYEKWIEVDISEQRTTAYERATPVNNFLIASGTKGHETVIGEFEIWLKVRSQTMAGGSKASGDYYSIPNVEWVSYFYKDYALHGAWWREKFGAPASHGCVNMRNIDAKWIFDWAPMGTKVIVHA